MARARTGERAASRPGRLHRRGHAFRVERDVDDTVPLVDLDPARRGVTQQQLVERGARDLPRLRDRDARRDAKVGVSLGPSVAEHERGAPFLRKPRLPDERVGANRRQRVVDRREQRLADVEAWKTVALEQLDGVA